MKKSRFVDFDEDAGPKASKEDDATASDNRKVIVEDLIFIDDLEVIIYTTLRPQTSQIFISSMSKTPKTESVSVDPNQAKVFDLADLDADDMKESFINV